MSDFFYATLTGTASMLPADRTWVVGKRVRAISVTCGPSATATITYFSRAITQYDVNVNAGERVVLNPDGAAIKQLDIVVTGSGCHWLIEALEPV